LLSYFPFFLIELRGWIVFGLLPIGGNCGPKQPIWQRARRFAQTHLHPENRSVLLIATFLGWQQLQEPASQCRARYPPDTA
jgi:hypothetical protein